MSSTPTYDALPPERRLEIERELYERIFGKPFTDRSIPAEPSDRQREYLISCIRDAIIREGWTGAIPRHEQDPTRELTARKLCESPGQVHIVSRAARAESIREHLCRLCESDSLPHPLERYLVEVETLIGQNADGSPLTIMQWVAPEQVVLPEGVELADILGDIEIDEAEQETLRAEQPGGVLPTRPATVRGVECGVLATRIKGIRRRPIAERYLKKLGYKHNGARGGTGYVAFEKTRDDGVRLGCEFDFGTWRQTVVALFGYSGTGLSFRTPLRYWREPVDVPIVTTKLFKRTIEDVAFVVGELERFIDEA